MSESNNQADISSFFEKQQQKKKTQQTKQQATKQTTKQSDDPKLKEEQKNAKGGANNDFESSDEEDGQGRLDIGVGKVKDIKEVQKQNKMAMDAKQQSDFKWETMGGIQRNQPAAQ